MPTSMPICNILATGTQAVAGFSLALASPDMYSPISSLCPLAGQLSGLAAARSASRRECAFDQQARAHTALGTAFLILGFVFLPSWARGVAARVREKVCVLHIGASARAMRIETHAEGTLLRIRNMARA